MIKGVTHAHLGPIWYHSEPANVPYSPSQFLGWDFFCHILQKGGFSAEIKDFFLVFFGKLQTPKFPSEIS